MNQSINSLASYVRLRMISGAMYSGEPRSPASFPSSSNTAEPTVVVLWIRIRKFLGFPDPSLLIRIQILQSSSKKGKKNLDSYRTALRLF